MNTKAQKDKERPIAQAKLRYARISPRKARVVIGLVRGKNVAEAVNLLRFTRRAAAPLVLKLLDSAIANAKDRNASVNLDALYVRGAMVDKAPDRAMRRWRPRAMGRATKIVKGVSHITLILDSRAEA